MLKAVSFVIVILALVSCKDGKVDNGSQTAQEDTNARELYQSGSEGEDAKHTKHDKDNKKGSKVDFENTVRLMISENEEDERIQKYIDFAKKMGTSIKSGPKDFNNFHSLAKEIVIHESADMLERIEKRLRENRRKAVIWRSVIRWGGNDKKPVLEKWSMQNPDVVSLIPFRKDGYQVLLEKVRDKSLHGNTRTRSAQLLVSISNENTIRHLQEFIDDETKVGLPSAFKATTLGEEIKKCIDRIRKKNLKGKLPK